MTEDTTEHPVILFDGVCNLCSGSVQFVIRRDPEGVFRFAPLQSSVGEQLLAEHGLEDHDLDSVVLLEDGEVYVKSDAAIRVGARLGGVYRLLSPFRYLPRRLRDAVYDVIADRRYDWFGQKDQCMMPSPEIESRFLAGGPASGSQPSDE